MAKREEDRRAIFRRVMWEDTETPLTDEEKLKHAERWMARIKYYKKKWWGRA